MNDYPELAAIVGANVPDYRGMFLRGHGSRTHTQRNGWRVGNTATTHVSGNLNEVQGDAMRNLLGNLNGGFGGFMYGNSRANNWSGYDGVFGNASYGSRFKITYTNEGTYYEVNTGAFGGFWMESGNVHPVANEIRPINVAVKYIICAKE